ncbi:MAG: pyruvate, water dikinase regulatory protein [Acidimicrobiia bacterium]
MQPLRTVFCVSDHTGMTAEAFAHSLIARFEPVDARYETRPFVDAEKIAAVVDEIDVVAGRGPRPIVFSTLSDPGLQDVLRHSQGLVIGLFDHFVDELSEELGLSASRRPGQYHGIGDAARYQLRLDAVDFALMTDDGLGIDHYVRADVILVGVSRVGKTPTCLSLAMHYGIRAANYPVAPEDHPDGELPVTLRTFRDRLYGLTIDPGRLHTIRMQRRPDSEYSDLAMCKRELAHADRMFRSERLPIIDTTSRSIEEITATIIESAELHRRVD